MSDKVKKPIQQLQQLRRLSYNPTPAPQGQAQGPATRQGNLEEMQLEKVIGTSSKGSNSLQVNPLNGDICYLAGSRLVIYSPRDAKQIKFLASRTSRPFQCARFSNDGKYLAAGESAFRLPQITIWEIAYEETSQVKVNGQPAEGANQLAASPAQSGEQSQIVHKAVSYTEIKHLQGHKYGIEAVVFSPRNDFLISLGDPNDRGLFVWDWRNETKISQNKLSKPATLVEISPQQDFFVTAGYQHLKYWYINEETGLPDARKPNEKSPPIIQAQSADLTKVKVQIFVGVAIQGPKVFTIAQDGHIYVYDKQRKLLKWMNIKVPRAFSCSAQEGRLYCACSDGIVRIFDTETLQHLLSLSKPPPLGSTNLLAGNGRIKIQQNKATKFADVICCALDRKNNRAVALYSDRMMFVWDVAELKSVTVLRSMYSHSGPIHDVQVVGNKHQIGLNQKSMSRPRCENEDNLTKFVTCSSDRTIRFWNHVDPTIPSAKHQEIYQCLAKNAYCKDMSQMIFITSALRESAEPQEENPKTPYDHFKAPPPDRSEDGQMIDQADQSGLNIMDMVDSIRCIRVSPDGTELASGDEVGNIRVHSLLSNELPQMKLLESHDSEVISLAYSSSVPSARFRDNDPSAKKRYLLASGGRDKQVLLYDSERDYEAFMNMDHHTSTITSLSFNEFSSMEQGRQSGQPSYKKHIELYSSSADRNLISKELDLNRFLIYSSDLSTAAEDFDNPLFKHNKTQICKDKTLSMDVAASAQYLATGHDKSLCLWKLPTFEKVWEKRVATMEKEQANKQQSGTNQVQLRVLVDDYASVVVSSSTSKRVTIYEAATGTPLCRAQPGQITTAMCFSNNMRHLVTTSDNGLIFIWRLPERLAQCLQSLKNEGQRLAAAIERTPSIIEETGESEDELGDSAGPKASAFGDNTTSSPDKRSKTEPMIKKRQENKEGDDDFDFEVPENLKPSMRDNTVVKKRKEEVVDVLADIAKATNFIDQLVQKETPKVDRNASIKFDEEIKGDLGAEGEDFSEEDDEAVDITKAKKKPEYPFVSKLGTAEHVAEEGSIEESKTGSPGLTGSKQCPQIEDHLSDGESDSENVVAGEQEGENEGNADAQEREIWRKIEQRKYQQRFTNYNDEESESRMQQMRRSSEIMGRRSITSKMMMRRSTTYVPANLINNEVQQQAEASLVDRQRTKSEQVDQLKMFDRRTNLIDVDPVIGTVPAKDQVTDIVNDKTDVLIPKGSKSPRSNAMVNFQDFQQPVQTKPLKINDFEASLENQNKNAKLPPSPSKPDIQSQKLNPKRERAGWGAADPSTLQVSPVKKDLLQSEITGDDKFRDFTAMRGESGKDRSAPIGKTIDTRPTIVFDKPKISVPGGQQRLGMEEKVPQRQRSPIKRVMDKMFGRSPDKKRVGASAVQLVDPIKPIQNQPTVNVSNYNIKDNYIEGQDRRTSPTAKSQPVLFRGRQGEERAATEKTSTPALPTQVPSLPKHQSQNIADFVTASPVPSMPKHLSQNLPAASTVVHQDSIQEEQKFNSALQAEINSINASLKRINGLVSEQKRSSGHSQQNLLESQISMEFQDPPVATTRVHDSVSSQLFKTMTQWNHMIKDLSASTNFDLEKVSMSHQSSVNSQNMLLHMDSSRYGLSERSGAGPHSQAATAMSRETIREDTRDLLDKYSQLLLESLQAKLSGGAPDKSM